MKYKRRKGASSKYISQSTAEAKKEAHRRARLKRVSGICVFVLVLMFCVVRVGGFGERTMSVINSALKSPFLTAVTEFAGSKIAFVSDIGKKGAEFCFGYLRGEDEKEEKVFAESQEPEADSAAHSQAPAAAVSEYVFEPSMPCNGQISSPFGERVHPLSGEGSFHNGIDIAADAGTSVSAVADGIVEKSTYNQYSGNFIVIRHDDEYTSSYAHLAESRVSMGDTVSNGDIIGLVGSTGAATGPHLHMEIRKNGEPVDPLAMIPKEGQR